MQSPRTVQRRRVVSPSIISLIIIVLFLLPSQVFAGQRINPFTSKLGICVSYDEEDGSPQALACQPLSVTNGTLTDSGDGTFSLDIAAGATTATGWTDDGTTVRLTTSTDNVSAGADSEPSTEKLQVTGDIYTTSTMVFEGSTANDFETALTVVDPTADRTITFPNHTGTVNVSGADFDQGAFDITVQNLEMSGASILANATASGVLTLGGTGGSNNGTVTLDFESTALTTVVDTGGALGFRFETPVIMDDNDQLTFGTGLDASFFWLPDGPTDHLSLGLETGSATRSGFFHITQRGDQNSANRRPAGTSTDPVLRIYSSDETSATDYLEFFHDQTDSRIQSGTGTINFDDDNLVTTGTLTMSTDKTITLGSTTIQENSTQADLVINNDVNIEQAHPHLEFRDTSDDVAYQWHLDTAATFANLTLWRGTNSGSGFNVSPVVPLLQFDNSNNMVITTPTVDVSNTLIVREDAVFDGEVDDGNSGSTDTIDWSTGNKHKSTLNDNVTYTFTDPGGPCNLVLKLVQDGTGGRAVTWPSEVKWPGGVSPGISSGASDVDIVTFYFDGTNYYGQLALNFS